MQKTAQKQSIDCFDFGFLYSNAFSVPASGMDIGEFLKRC